LFQKNIEEAKCKAQNKNNKEETSM